MADQIPGAEKKVVAGVLAILLGAFGIHKFYLGYNTAGIIMLVVTVVTCGFAGTVMAVIGIVEGIIYLTKTDAEFVSTYITNKKEWF
jgi:TM2 domain-containing membrane protein YozV